MTDGALISRFMDCSRSNWAHVLRPRLDELAFAHRLIEEAGIVVAVIVLRGSPAVEHLEDQQHALLIADLGELARMRVMGDADGVAPHVLEEFDLALEGVVCVHGAE